MLKLMTNVDKAVPRCEAAVGRSVKWMAMLMMICSASIVSAQETIKEFELKIVEEEIPAGGFMMGLNNYITMNGLFEYDPMEYYRVDKEEHPEIFNILPNDTPGAINFTMETNFWGVDGSSFKDEETFFVNSGIKNKRMLTGGRYKGFKWTYWQLNPNMGPNQPERIAGTRTTGAKVIFPVIRKVPFYIASDLLQGVTFKSEDKFVRFLEPTSYEDAIGFEASKVAMDLSGGEPTEKDHFVCPIHYEFKFMGYVEGFPDGVTGVPSAAMEDLPEGLTFVSAIQDCSGITKPNKQTLGCAAKGGSRLAVRMDLVTDRISGARFTLGAVMLHELLHTQGSGHVEGDSENLMTDEDVLDAPYLDQAQCEMLIKRKSYAMGFSGFEPWE